MRFIVLFSLAILMVGMLVRGQVAPLNITPPEVAASDAPPTTQPAIHGTDLLGPLFTSHVHGIEFRPPLNSVQADKPAPIRSPSSIRTPTTGNSRPGAPTSSVHCP